jgi:hypothetical protein
MLICTAHVTKPVKKAALVESIARYARPFATVDRR